MRLLFIALVAATLCFGGYYFFVDTLTLNEIAESSENRAAAFFAPLMDFDTGLTRWDMHRLSGKADDWKARWRETASIPNLSERSAEQKKILNEMMADPSVRKISDRMAGFGEASARSLMEMLSGK